MTGRTGDLSIVPFDAPANPSHEDTRTLRELVEDGEVYQLVKAELVTPLAQTRSWICRECDDVGRPLFEIETEYLIIVRCPTCGALYEHLQRRFFNEMPL
ncbi:hypothetical protein [Halegenticoccus tardaugens]|uniref:hypothetical protein n=1 Tax=Halegenticoccus tardaugens TaxID=2071624 RepID=UPI00100AB266|nr:hypothetical protein [Halegenticoccus tardaugens]